MKGLPDPPQLEEAIYAEPGNRDAWAVYGDWLQTRGDPRGEMIALDLSLLKTPADSDLRQRLHQLYKMNQSTLAPLEMLPPRNQRGYYRLNWFGGFIQSFYASQTMGMEETSTLECAQELFQLPAISFLQRIEISAEHAQEPTRLQPLLNVMSEATPFRALRILNWNINNEIEYVTADVLGNLFEFGPILEEFSLKIRNFEMRSMQYRDLEKRFQSHSRSTLKRIRLETPGHMGVLLMLLMNSPICESLEELELTYGPFDERPGRSLLVSRNKLKRLRKLVIHGRHHFNSKTLKSLTETYGRKLDLKP